jgi:hypothetical protein
MKVWRIIGTGAAVLGGSSLAIGYAAYRSARRDADLAYERLAARSEPPGQRFDPAQISGLPEIAHRYFRHAVAPGTPIYSGLELEMEGNFLLGDKAKHQGYRMKARQVLTQSAEFVWMPRLRSGAMTITGSDARVAGEAWTRFWMLGVLPVANVTTSPDMLRSAQFRGVVESALWLPTTLLPENGARWEQVGQNEARVTLTRFSPAIALHLKLDESGAVREVIGQRWSNANREQRFRLQPFGGMMSKEATFGGLTIPTEISVGNHYGTEEYLPFFQARITRVRYF